MGYKANLVSCLIIVLCCANCHLNAQIEKFPESVFNKQKLPLGYLPFASVEVIDARFDTTGIFTAETGDYPPVKTNFEIGLAANIKNYVGKAILQIPHGDKKLLVKLNQCRILNRQRIKRDRGRPSLGFGRLSHEHLLLDAELYYLTKDGRYQKILHIVHRRYVSDYYKYIQDGFADAFNDLIMAVCATEVASEQENDRSYKLIRKDSLSYEFNYDSTANTFSEIEASTAERWKLTPILTANKDKDGIYESFDDFRNNRIQPKEIALHLLSKDSIFQFLTGAQRGEKKRRTYPYGIVYDNNIYINIYDDIYLLVEQKNDRLRFYVPKSLPDMYAILSYEIYLFSNQNSYIFGPGAVISIISFLSSVGIDAAAGKAAKKRSEKKGLENNFRYCLIDLDNGDFLYADRDIF